MIKLPLNVPKPSKWTKYLLIDDIANELNIIYKNQLEHPIDNVVNVEEFIDEYLNIKTVWDEIVQPNNRICFAKLSFVNNKLLITVNENHRSTFDSKPFLLRSCLSHEIGHITLRHIEKLLPDTNQSNLFGYEEPSSKQFHDSAWNMLGLSPEDFTRFKNHQAKKFWKDEVSRKFLESLKDCLEEEWMFRQAEQFSACFLIPKDILMESINEGLDISDWHSLYQLRDKFEVSITMMIVRLEKLGFIKVHGKSITVTDKLKQKSLIN